MDPRVKSLVKFVTALPTPLGRRPTKKIAPMKQGLLILATCALVLAAPTGASAGRPHSVDPAIMQPALNASFAPWECWRTGTGTVCEGERALSWEAAETGLVCDGRMVYTTGTDKRTQRRYGDENGLAVRTVQHVDIRETLGLNPDLSGITLQGAGHFQETFEYLVPGDLSSRTDRYTGLDVRVTGPGVGLVIHDVGIKTFDFDDNVVIAHGPHPVVEDFEGTFAKICDAFALLGA